MQDLIYRYDYTYYSLMLSWAKGFSIYYVWFGIYFLDELNSILEVGARYLPEEVMFVLLKHAHRMLYEEERAYYLLHFSCTGASLYGIMQMMFLGGF